MFKSTWSLLGYLGWVHGTMHKNIPLSCMLRITSRANKTNYQNLSEKQLVPSNLSICPILVGRVGRVGLVSKHRRDSGVLSVAGNTVAFCTLG